MPLGKSLAATAVGLALLAMPPLARAQAPQPDAAPAASTPAVPESGDAADAEPTATEAAPAPTGAAPSALPDATEQVTYLTAQPAGALFASDLIGEPVQGSTGKKIGDINDVLLGPDGSMIAVIIGTGGFLGVGEKDVAVPPTHLQMRPSGDKVTLEVNATEAMLVAAPTFVRADGTTSDRLGGWTRAYDRAAADARAAYEAASEQAGELYEEGKTRARKLLNQ